MEEPDNFSVNLHRKLTNGEPILFAVGKQSEKEKEKILAIYLYTCPPVDKPDKLEPKQFRQGPVNPPIKTP
jgi:hypothetical protein